jgi:hypothetical protein
MVRDVLSMHNGAYGWVCVVVCCRKGAKSLPATSEICEFFAYKKWRLLTIEGDKIEI